MPRKRTKVLVVGSTGYIGAYLCRRLANEDATIFAWGRKPLNHQLHHVIGDCYQIGDVTSSDTLEQMVAQAPDAVIYCVSMSQNESDDDIKKTIAVNVTPVWELADRFNKSVGNPLRFIYLSTAHVYGNLEGLVDEHVTPRPQNAYGLTHLMAEQALQCCSGLGRVQPLIIRLSNVYGPSLDRKTNSWKLVLNDFCRTAFTTQEIHIHSDGSPQRDFIYMDDVTAALSLFIRIPYQEKSNVYNLGSGSSQSMWALAQTVSEIYRSRYDKEVTVLQGDGSLFQAPPREKITPSFRYVIELARRAGFHPAVSINLGINQIFDYLEKEE